MAEKRNTQLEALLAEFGYTHQQLADEVNRVAGDHFDTSVNCTDRHVRRWISGDVQWPWSRYLQPLERIFGRSAQELGFVARNAAAFRVASRQTNAQEQPTVQRRTFIAGALTATLGIDRTPQRGRLGMTDVERIRSTIARLDSHFNGLGGAALVDAATDYLTRLQRALDHCVYGERVERALTKAVADVAACAGWSAHDCGDYARAAQLRNQALQAALLARDPVAVTRAWSDLAAQAEHGGMPAEAARINRAALSERHLRAAPLITSLLHSRLADCLAQINDPKGMGRQLAAAERVYDRADRTEAASWLAFLTPAELSGLGALAHQSAGLYGRAEEQVAHTLDLLDAKFVRNRAYYTVLLAELQLAQGDAERAVATVSGVQVSGVMSGRIADRMERVTAAAHKPEGRP
ncbi:transcriptional regulator [Streptomyces antibioticus]|uniref:transcriptional regulator n=1 Tax=Streptomyces antibioticus TaxID=1890 RepID=UPI00371653ED